MQKRIEELTGISADERSSLMYDSGLRYLEIISTPHTSLGKEHGAAIAHEISASRTFWRWWVSHWECRDQVFCDSLGRMADKGTPISRSIVIQLYHANNDPVALSCELAINGHVLQESYAAMIGHVNKEILSKIPNK